MNQHQHQNQTPSSPTLNFDKAKKRYQCQGAWSIFHMGNFLTHFYATDVPEETTIAISGEGLEALDSAGALTLLLCKAALTKKGKEVTLIDFKEKQQALLNLIAKQQKTLEYEPKPPVTQGLVEQIGREAVEKGNQFDGFIILLGDLSSKIFAAFGDWRRFQFPSIVSNIYSAGIQALPILSLLGFLIGVVLAYQMGLQLKTYGANTYIAYLSGLAIFREFGPLITAIIVAGRTSSAFTAQIGSMKINEEIDALKTMGLPTTEYLVMPKVLALLFIFPLLIFWADFFSILGSLYMSKWMLNIGYVDFLLHLKESVGIDQLRLGLYKAPAFAILTALVGCFQGFRVDADTIGQQTTKSVVQALFMIIVADAIYSVIYSWLRL